MKFVHLEVAGEFTYHFDSLVRIQMLVKKAKELNMDTIALTDYSTMHSVIDFYELSIQNGIKPIIGCKFEVIDESKKEITKVVLLAKNNDGYKNIVQLNSTAHLRENNKVYITKKELKKHSDDIVILVDLEDYFIKNQTNKSMEELKFFKNNFDSHDLYFQLKRHGLKHQKIMNQYVMKASKTFGIKLVATNDVYYFNEKESKTRNILRKIQEIPIIDEFDNNQQYLKTETEMEKLFSDIPSAIENTVEIANKCNIKITLKGDNDFVRKIPVYKVPNDFVPPKTLKGKFDILPNFQKPKTKKEALSIAYLCHLAERGLEKRYGDNEVAKKRLRYELGVIISKGFSNYFLIVQDFVKYAKENKIPIGRGRGSAPASILSYALGITDVCPLKYNLLFERFLNPERTDDPDIDLDISQEMRYKMIEYAQEKYGQRAVGKITTFNNFGGKLAVREVGRILKVESTIIDKIAKSINKKVNDVFDKKELVKELIEKHMKVKELIEYALLIEGLPKNRSTHAAGVIIGDGDLSKEIPVMERFDKEIGKKIIIVQFPNNNQQLEKVGYTKKDFLGLRNLDVIENTKKLISERTGKKIDEMPLDDDKTFKLYQEGNLLGVFQMDSEQMRKTSEKIKPTKVEDIFPLIALYRPGSMDMIPIYATNKEKNNAIIYDMVEEFDEKNKRFKKDFVPFDEKIEDLEPILKETFGVIVYQEQIMKILQKWANYGLGEADIVRRAISKKKKEIIDEERKKFISKAKEMNRDEEVSEKIYDLIVKFSNYGFNIPHSAAYGLISYETAYLKANYPVEFMSALISSKIDETKQASDYVKEAKRMGVVVHNPSINFSNHDFVPCEDEISFGLAMIKNVGKNAAKYIEEDRRKGNYDSFQQFVNRVHSKEVNEGCIESLIKVGAFDEFGGRKQLIEYLKGRNKRKVVIKDLITFDEIPGIQSDTQIELPDVGEYGLREKINYETSLTAMAFSEKPISKYGNIIEDYVEMKNSKENDFLWIGAEFESRKVIKDKYGNEMAFLTINCGEKQYELVSFYKVWSKVKDYLDDFGIYLFKVKENKSGKFVLHDVEKLESKRKISIVVPDEVRNQTKDLQLNWMKDLASLVRKNKGNEVFALKMEDKEKKYYVSFNEEFLIAINKLVKEKKNIRLEKVQYT